MLLLVLELVEKSVKLIFSLTQITLSITLNFALISIGYILVDRVVLHPVTDVNSTVTESPAVAYAIISFVVSPLGFQR